jgi:unsaturated chondroitin disaccharide hydrolase
MELAATNARAGLIPTTGRSACSGCAAADEADTIIDSMMNLDLLLWAARQTGSERFRDVARRHAANVARLLVRADGSTIQSVHVRRTDGAVLSFHTHQGYSDASTWGRGQSWAVYGFARTARQLRSAELLAVAERIARYIERRLPATAIPPWDYDAPAPAPADTSAGVIAAAGLFELARACARMGGCAEPARWSRLAEQILGASLARVDGDFPLGVLRGQIGGRPRPAEADGREYVFGLFYALDAIRRAG